MGRSQRRLMFFVWLVLYALGAQCQPAASASVDYQAAESAFNRLPSLHERLLLQVLMTASGYWNSVAAENFSPKLFKAIQKFQSENGFTQTGVLPDDQLKRLVDVGGAKLDAWGFQSIRHPTRNLSLWIPFGLNFTSTRDANGIRYEDALKRISIDFTTFQNNTAALTYNIVVNILIERNYQIHYKVFKNDWFVVSATSLAGVDEYYRYHQDRENVTGFSVSWKNLNGDVNGDRIAILMSNSFWSEMTHAKFIDAPGRSASIQARALMTPNPEYAPAPPTPSAFETPPPLPTSPSPTPQRPPAASKSVSTGTGFFVSADGKFVSNAHVVEGCKSVTIRTDDGKEVQGVVTARDPTNDLALINLPKSGQKFAALRNGVRLGEGISAFGFPHSDVLSTNGNFTTGNITALNGIKDDSRYYQISAPVQAGNSGGPLLDLSGNAVGIVSSKLNALKMMVQSGDLPQNVNFAIKANALASFLESNKVPFETGVLSAAPMLPADIADKAKSISGFVMCFSD